MTTAQTNVGSYTLTVTGKGNYTGKIENVNWKIEPMQLYRFCDIEPVTKVYDGTAWLRLPKVHWHSMMPMQGVHLLRCRRMLTTSRRPLHHAAGRWNLCGIAEAGTENPFPLR